MSIVLLSSYCKLFAGLSIIGERENYQDRGKGVNYNVSNQEALKCFQSKPQVKYESDGRVGLYCPPGCEAKNTNNRMCFPDKSSRWWVDNSSLVNAEHNGTLHF